jgi:hypothetical protein
MVLATSKVGTCGMEFTCPLNAGLDARALLGNSSLGHCTGSHLLPGLVLRPSFLAKECHVGSFEGFIGQLLLSHAIAVHSSAAFFRAVVTMSVSSVRVHEEFMTCGVDFDVLPSSSGPSAGNKFHLFTLLVNLFLHHVLHVA